MKTIAHILIAGLLATFASPVSAAPLKIGIVDMQKVYMQFYKTRINDSELEKDKATVRAELEKRKKTFDGLREELNAKVKNLRGTTEGSASRKKAEEEFHKQQAELQSLARDIDEFAERRRKMIGDKLKRMQDTIIVELQTQVTKSSAGYDLVFDKTGISTSGVGVMIFSKDAIDFTDSVIKAVNADAPADVPEKPAAPPAVTTPTEGESAPGAAAPSLTPSEPAAPAPAPAAPAGKSK